MKSLTNFLSGASCHSVNRGFRRSIKESARAKRGSHRVFESGSREMDPAKVALCKKKYEEYKEIIDQHGCFDDDALVFHYNYDDENLYKALKNSGIEYYDAEVEKDDDHIFIHFLFGV